MLKAILASCHPHADVPTGDLREDMRAAKLKTVMEKVTDPVHQAPPKCLGNTLPTEGLKPLFHEVLRRLSGADPAYSPFIRRKNCSGGGKTHDLAISETMGVRIGLLFLSVKPLRNTSCMNDLVRGIRPWTDEESPDWFGRMNAKGQTRRTQKALRMLSEV